MSRVVGHSYKRSHPEGKWDAIVIGSGMGGLATAALLAKYGDKRVLVLERHYTAGGYTHVFKRPGYEWDVGVHYVGEMSAGSPLAALLDAITGNGVRWHALPECYDRVIIGERAFDLVAGRERFVAALCEHFPRERRTLERYWDLVLGAARRGAPFFADRMLPAVFSRTLGALLRFRFLRYSDRTTESVLRPLVRDRMLYDVLTAQCGDYGLTPREGSFAIHAFVAAHFFDGAFYPIGGPAEIARGAEEVIAAAGGSIYTNATVSRIVVENGRAVGVEMEDGRRIDAQRVVSDAGAANTFFELLAPEVAAKIGFANAIRAVGPSTGHLCLHLGFRNTDDELGLDGTNLWIYPEGDREEAFARFAADPSAPIPLTYVSFPSAKDPSFGARHPGKSTIEVITLARIEWFRRWADAHWKKRGEAYEAFKSQLAERLLAILFRHRPELRGRVDYAELSTPLTTRHFTAHPSGAMYGLSHPPARFRIPLRARTPIEGLYLTGADLAACGIGGAVIGGAVCAGAMLQGELLSLVRRRVFAPRPTLAADATNARAIRS
jgi:phytoene dehydrogenase-like protein